MVSLLDAFFGETKPKNYASAAAREFFAAHAGARGEKAKAALREFEKLPEAVRAAVFARAKVEPRKLYELSARERVRLSDAAEKIMDEVAAKLALVKKAASSLDLLVKFKGDRLPE